LRVDGGNWQAANELGVLLARQGRNEEAARHLRHSVAVRPQGESLHNLAVVLHHSGETTQAREAHERSIAMGYTPSRSRRPEVQWVSPQALAGAERNSAAEALHEARLPSGPRPNIRHEDAKAAPSAQNRKPSKSWEQDRAESKPADPAPAEANARGLFWWLYRK
jgi:Flp pilus assembly protein TadD